MLYTFEGDNRRVRIHRRRTTNVIFLVWNPWWWSLVVRSRNMVMLGRMIDNRSRRWIRVVFVESVRHGRIIPRKKREYIYIYI